MDLANARTATVNAAMATAAIRVNNHINNDGSTREDSNALIVSASAGKARKAKITAAIVNNTINNNRGARAGSYA